MSKYKPYLLMINGTLDGHYLTTEAAFNRLVFRRGYFKSHSLDRPFFAQIIFEPKTGTCQTVYEGDGSCN